jgi:tetratricopeptide (TPR) repeat protein
VFGLFCLTPGPNIGLPAVASLVDLPAMRARALLRDLSAGQLVQEPVPERYRMHDLVRLYASEQVFAVDAEGERRAALLRLLDHYLHTAYTAALLLNPHREPITLDRPQTGVAAEDLTDYGHALAWFTTEHGTLLAAIDRAADAGFDRHTWQLAGTLATFLDRSGNWHDRAATQHAALAAARRLSDKSAQAHAHRGLARARTQLDRYDDPTAHLQHALEMFAELGDDTGLANVHLEIARMLDRQGRHRDALDDTERALAHYRAAGNRSGQADALNGLGWLRVQLGDHGQALTYCQQALSLHQELGYRHGEANTWDSLGFAHHHLGHHQLAITCYQQAVDLHRSLAGRHAEADTLTKLGDTHYAAGDIEGARQVWQRALAIFNESGLPEAGRVRAKLHHLPVAPPVAAGAALAPCSTAVGRDRGVAGGQGAHSAVRVVSSNSPAGSLLVTCLRRDRQRQRGDVQRGPARCRPPVSAADGPTDVVPAGVPATKPGSVPPARTRGTPHCSPVDTFGCR